MCALPASAATILVYGDSLSAGYGLSNGSNWVALMRKKLAESHPDYRVVNASISGETATGGAERILTTLTEHHPDILILELGANDGLRGKPLNVLENDLNTIIAECRKAKIKVLLVGMRLPPNYGTAYTKQFQQIYHKVALRNKLPLLPFLLDGVQPEQFQADNLHPNATAQPIILNNVLLKLLPLL